MNTLINSGRCRLTDLSLSPYDLILGRRVSPLLFLPLRLQLDRLMSELTHLTLLLCAQLWGGGKKSLNITMPYHKGAELNPNMEKWAMKLDRTCRLKKTQVNTQTNTHWSLYHEPRELIVYESLADGIS